MKRGSWLQLCLGAWIHPWLQSTVREDQNMWPQKCHLVCGLFWAEGHQDAADSRKTFTSFNYLKEFRWNVWPKRKLLPKITFYLKDLSVKKDKHPIIKHSLFLSSCELPSSSLKPQASIPFLTSGGHVSLNWPICYGVSYSYGTPIGA